MDSMAPRPSQSFLAGYSLLDGSPPVHPHVHTEDRKMFQVAENDEVFGELDQVEGDVAGEGRGGKGRERYKKYFWNFKQFKSVAEEWPWVQASCH